MAKGSVSEKPSQKALFTALRRAIAHLYKAAIESELLARADGSRLGQITGHFRFIVVTPENQ